MATSIKHPTAADYEAQLLSTHTRIAEIVGRLDELKLAIGESVAAHGLSHPHTAPLHLERRELQQALDDLRSSIVHVEGHINRTRAEENQSRFDIAHKEALRMQTESIKALATVLREAPKFLEVYEAYADTQQAFEEAAHRLTLASHACGGELNSHSPTPDVCTYAPIERHGLLNLPPTELRTTMLHDLAVWLRQARKEEAEREERDAA